MKLRLSIVLTAVALMPMALFGQIGTFASHDKLTVRSAKAGRLMEESLDTLRKTWKKPLDW